jgi:hypothetical protein
MEAFIASLYDSAVVLMKLELGDMVSEESLAALARLRLF